MTNPYASLLNNRNIMQPMRPRRTVEQVQRRYEYMQELNTKIEDQKKFIEKHETIINRAREEILKAQEILNFLSRGENLPGETY